MTDWRRERARQEQEMSRTGDLSVRLSHLGLFSILLRACRGVTAVDSPRCAACDLRDACAEQAGAAGTSAGRGAAERILETSC